MLRVIKHIIVEVRLPLDRLRAWNGARERWGDFSDPQAGTKRCDDAGSAFRVRMRGRHTDRLEAVR